MKNLMDKYPRVLDLLPKAKKRLPHFASEYLFSGTGYDLAIKNNTEILKNIFLTPKYVQGVVEPNLKVNLFGDIYEKIKAWSRYKSNSSKLQSCKDLGG